MRLIPHDRGPLKSFPVVDQQHVFISDGDAIRVPVNGQNVLLRNNILVVASGYAISVPSNSQMGFGSDWNKAVEAVKNKYVEPGQMIYLVRDLSREAIDFIEKHELVTIPALPVGAGRTV